MPSGDDSDLVLTCPWDQVSGILPHLSQATWYVFKIRQVSHFAESPMLLNSICTSPPIFRILRSSSIRHLDNQGGARASTLYCKVDCLIAE